MTKGVLAGRAWPGPPSLRATLGFHRFAMHKPLRVLVQEYRWVHLTLGLIGNITFLLGSVLFLPAFEAYRTLGTWLFIAGAFLMLVGSLGRAAVDLWEQQARRRERRRRAPGWRQQVRRGTAEEHDTNARAAAARGAA